MTTKLTENRNVESRAVSLGIFIVSRRERDKGSLRDGFSSAEPHPNSYPRGFTTHQASNLTREPQHHQPTKSWADLQTAHPTPHSKPTLLKPRGAPDLPPIQFPRKPHESTTMVSKVLFWSGFGKPPHTPLRPPRPHTRI